MLKLLTGTGSPTSVKYLALAFAIFAATGMGAEARIWRDPGPIASLDLAAGPEGKADAPVAPYKFVKEVTSGITPKMVVTDARGHKWMVKFGEEAKPEVFASRIAWAAGYPAPVSYYIPGGRIEGAHSLHRVQSFLKDGAFSGAQFQKFYGDGFREVPGGKLDLNARLDDPRELNGLKLALLLVANWDVKPANTGVFDIEGQRYAIVTDWGASMGDPSATDPAARKWNCAAYSARTKTLVEGVENGFVQFNYGQYASRHEHALSSNIRVADLNWFLTRMKGLSDEQVKSALLASGATADEAACFTRAFRERLNRFAAATGPQEETIRSRKVITTTTTEK